MAQVNKLRLITDLGELVYKESNGLNITLNRIVDDFTDVSNRFADFSYEFDLPVVKENSIVFSYADAMGQKKIFVKNKNIGCRVYLNNTLLLDGLVNLISINQTSFKCKLFSKFKELIDVLNTKDSNGKTQTLKNLNFPLVLSWNYETSVINHIAAYGDKDSDSTTHQFPLIFYSTMFCQADIYSGKTDLEGYYFNSDRDAQNYYYTFNSVNSGATNFNRFYIHQLPPAIYIVSIVKQILIDAGWRLGGQFFNDRNLKKIVLLYAGDDDIYDQATERVNGSTALNLQIAKFLPDKSQSDFLKDIINMFNLYFRIDVNNKVIEFETYDTYLNNNVAVPYNITNKVKLDTLDIGYIENNNPTIEFKAPNNSNVMGDNMVMSGYTNNAYEQKWLNCSNKNFNQLFNRVGTTDSISIDFSAPTVKKQYIYNDWDKYGVHTNSNIHKMYLPLLSKQTPSDNNNMKFNKKDTDSWVFNNESSIKYQGNGSLMYYYGISPTDFVNKEPLGSLGNYMYINIFVNSVINRVPIGICSPFQLTGYRDEINKWLSGVTNNNIEDRRTTTSTYLQALWQIMGRNDGVAEKYSTDFSLVFDDLSEFHQTLWTKFHKNKWTRYKNSELYTVDIRMNEYDWQQMQINRPIQYYNEKFALVSIENYNPISRNATIKMIKIL